MPNVMTLKELIRYSAVDSLCMKYSNNIIQKRQNWTLFVKLKCQWLESKVLQVQIVYTVKLVIKGFHMITLCCQRQWQNEKSVKHERIIKWKLTKQIEQNELIPIGVKKL